MFNKEMLFNLSEDPYEQHDLAEQHREICMEAVYYLNEWHDKMMHTMKTDVDPLWKVMLEGGPYHTQGFLEQYVERLENTGRSEGADELWRRHGYKQSHIHIRT